MGQSGTDTVVESHAQNSNPLDSNIGSNFETAASSKIEFKTKSYINGEGILTTDLIFPDEQLNKGRKPHDIAKTYRRRGIQCEVVSDTQSPAIVRFAGQGAAKLQKDKSMHGRLKLRAQPQEGKVTSDVSQTLKVQSWKTNISSKTGQFYATLPLGNEPVSYTHLTLPTICSV